MSNNGIVEPCPAVRMRMMNRLAYEKRILIIALPDVFVSVSEGFICAHQWFIFNRRDQQKEIRVAAIAACFLHRFHLSVLVRADSRINHLFI